MDSMIDRRRELLNVLAQLFERCTQADQLTQELGLKSATSCPKRVDERNPMAAEFERALGWLIGHIGLVMNEMRSIKQRVHDGQGKLNRGQQTVKDMTDQAKKCQDTNRNLTEKLNDLNNMLKEAT